MKDLNRVNEAREDFVKDLWGLWGFDEAVKGLF